jgi:hypothetical protein
MRTLPETAEWNRGRRLTKAGTDDGDHRAGRNADGDAAQDGRARLVGEANVVEFDLAGKFLKNSGARKFADFFLKR